MKKVILHDLYDGAGPMPVEKYEYLQSEPNQKRDWTDFLPAIFVFSAMLAVAIPAAILLVYGK